MSQIIAIAVVLLLGTASEGVEPIGFAQEPLLTWLPDDPCEVLSPAQVSASSGLEVTSVQRVPSIAKVVDAQRDNRAPDPGRICSYETRSDFGAITIVVLPRADRSAPRYWQYRSRTFETFGGSARPIAGLGSDAWLAGGADLHVLIRDNEYFSVSTQLYQRSSGDLLINIARAVLARTRQPQQDAAVPVASPRPPYFGQPTPETTPERFAPGVVSTDAIELNGVFTPDGREFFFTRLIEGVDTMHHSVYEGATWSHPRPLLVFPGRVRAVAVDMSVSPDGQELYFLGQHPHKDAPDKPGYDLWVSRRVDGAWSTAQVVPDPVSTAAEELYPVVVADGSLYFTSNRPGGLGNSDVYRAQRRADGSFTEPVNVGPPINGEFGTGDTFVAPDESYLIISSRRPGGLGNGDLFVSFRQEDGRWGMPVNLGDTINTDQHEFCPMVTPDGKYLFFSRRWGATWEETTAGDVYWVDARVLDQFRRPTPHAAGTDCVQFQSPTRLAAGMPFRATLLRGLEFRLSDGWDISVGPVGDMDLDYLWVVSPPLRTAPHRVIGPGYGLSARDSARIERPLRFVLTRADYDAARAAIDDTRSADETLRQLDRLGRGTLSIDIVDYSIRDGIRRADGHTTDAFEWITFKGQACVPKQNP